MIYVVLSGFNICRKNIIGMTEDIKRRVNAIRNNGLNIPVVLCVEHSEYLAKNLNDLNYDIVKIFPRRHFYSYKSLRLPYSVLSRYNKDLLSSLREHDQEDSSIIFEGFQMANYLFWANIKKAKTILRVHNIESLYFMDQAVSVRSWFKKIIYYHESFKYVGYEKKMLNCFDELHFISRKEMHTVLKKKPELADKAKFVPPLLIMEKQHTYCCQGEKLKRLIYFGDLTIPANREGINWFIKEVWSQVVSLMRNEVEFHVAGAGSENFQPAPNVQFKGFVDNLPEFIATATAIVIPSRYGAGTQLKVLDSISYGCPLITTSKMLSATVLSGTGLVLEANDVKSMIKKCVDVLTDPDKYKKRALKAQEILLKSHSSRAYVDLLLNKNFKPSELGLL
jgi:glycosyltransferase involved in cell wall biosynthesis